MTSKSLKTIQAVKTVLNQQFPSHNLQVFDIFKNPKVTNEAQIMTTPTLIKKLPLPPRRISGDLTSQDRILCGLNIAPKTTLRGSKP
jgi:circadian clock protein KaiB